MLYQSLIHYIICIYILQTLSSLYHFFILFIYCIEAWTILICCIDPVHLNPSISFIMPTLEPFSFLVSMHSNLIVFRYIKTSSTFFSCFNACPTTYAVSRIGPLSFRNQCLVHFNLCINTSALL